MDPSAKLSRGHQVIAMNKRNAGQRFDAALTRSARTGRNMGRA